MSPTSEGSVWDIQLVTMAMVLSTAPIFRSGTLMSSTGRPPGPSAPPHSLVPGSRCSAQNGHEPDTPSSSSSLFLQPRDNRLHVYKRVSKPAHMYQPLGSDGITAMHSTRYSSAKERLPVPDSHSSAPSPTLLLSLSSLALSRCRAAHWLHLSLSFSPFLFPPLPCLSPALFHIHPSVFFLSSGSSAPLDPSLL